MTPDRPGEYNREYTHPLSRVTRVRLGYSHDRDEVVEFVVQLEYDVGDGDWRTVVRYDHNPNRRSGHNVTEEGLHIDIYRHQEKYRTEYISPPLPAAAGLDRAEDHLRNNLKGFIQRFETWHGIRRGP